MDPDEEIEFDFSPFLVVLKSGRVHRFGSTSRKNAGIDATTGVTSKDVVIDGRTGLATRLFLPKGVSESDKLPVVVYFHGGAFVVESAFSSRYTSYVNAVVAAARVVAVSVEYRLAPEHPLPAAYDDAWAALRWAAASCASGGPEPWLANHGDPARLFVAGNSAGANIAHNAALRAGKEGLPGGALIEGMALLHPLFLGKALVPSEGTDLAFTEGTERNWLFVCAGRYGVDHPFSNPLATPPEEWAMLGCRRALVTTVELDPLRDRARRYVEMLRGSAWGGEEAVLYETEGEEHLYYLRRDARSNSIVAEKAAKEMAVVVSFLRQSTSTCSIKSAL